VLIGNVQINIGVIWHFVLSFFLSIRYNTDYRQFMSTINFLFILRKSVNYEYSVNLFSNRNMNSTIVLVKCSMVNDVTNLH